MNKKFVYQVGNNKKVEPTVVEWNGNKESSYKENVVVLMHGFCLICCVICGCHGLFSWSLLVDFGTDVSDNHTSSMPNSELEERGCLCLRKL
jgi:hypothetical protein